MLLQDARGVGAELVQFQELTVWAFILYKSEECMTEVDYYRKLAEDCVFAARESVDQDVRDACMKDAAHFRALAKRIERRSVSDKGARSGSRGGK